MRAVHFFVSLDFDTHKYTESCWRVALSSLYNTKATERVRAYLCVLWVELNHTPDLVILVHVGRMQTVQ